MNAEELVGLTAWIDDEIVGRQIPRLYLDLATLIQNNANGSRGPFEEQKDRLIAQLEQVNLSLITDGQRDFIEQLKLLSHLGQDGIIELQEVLYKNSLDISTAATKVSGIASEIQNAVDRSNQIKAALLGLIDVYENPSDEVLIRVSFDAAASIDNIVDFKKWATIWYDIGRGIAMAVGETPEQVRVVGAQKGSIIIVIATTYAIAKLVSAILLNSLEVAGKVLSLKKAMLEIENLNLSNNILSDQIKETAVNEKKLGLEKISTEMEASIQNIDGEKITALNSSIAKLLDFVERGGKLDIVLPAALEENGAEASQDAVNGQASSLRSDVYRIRELEAEMKRIPNLFKED